MLDRRSADETLAWFSARRARSASPSLGQNGAFCGTSHLGHTFAIRISAVADSRKHPRVVVKELVRPEIPAKANFQDPAASLLGGLKKIPAQTDKGGADSPRDRPYWLIVARHIEAVDIKHFVSKPSANTAFEEQLKVAFAR
jgi:hypothetical protein